MVFGDACKSLLMPDDGIDNGIGGAYRSLLLVDDV